MVNIPENKLNVPVVSIAATNQNVTCEDKNVTGKDCQFFIASRDTIIQLAEE